MFAQKFSEKKNILCGMRKIEKNVVLIAMLEHLNFFLIHDTVNILFLKTFVPT
jgi:hypothetical protein